MFTPPVRDIVSHVYELSRLVAGLDTGAWLWPVRSGDGLLRLVGFRRRVVCRALCGAFLRGPALGARVRTLLERCPGANARGRFGDFSIVC